MSTLSQPLTDSAIMLRRNFKHTMRNPVIWFNAILFPIVMMFMFVYVLGDGFDVGGGAYVDYATPGMLMLAVCYGLGATATAVNSDVTKGIINRFRVMDVSRNTVRAALRSEGPPRYERAPAGSVADGFEPRIRELLAVYPSMRASVIGERIGWPYSDRLLRAAVAGLRPAYLPPDPASRTAYAAGELAQCDFWFPDAEVPVGSGQVRTAKQLPVLTMVCGYSRWASALLLPSRSAEDLFAGWRAEIEALGAVPRLLVWDGEGAVGRRRAGRTELTAECQAFRGTLAAGVYI